MDRGVGGRGAAVEGALPPPLGALGKCWGQGEALDLPGGAAGLVGRLARTQMLAAHSP